MTEVIFWDTSAFIALVAKDDSLHSRAVSISKHLHHAHAGILTTSSVLIEVANSLSKVTWRPLTLRIVDALQVSISEGTAEVIHVDSAIWNAGMLLYRERTDKDWSLTDCISFTVMHASSLTNAFTSDRHFTQAGFKALLAR
ncbi:MAG: type II toxin-antitoxin system VapC family toxin [Anaerolineae bacterium]